MLQYRNIRQHRKPSVIKPFLHFCLLWGLIFPKVPEKLVLIRFFIAYRHGQNQEACHYDDQTNQQSCLIISHASKSECPSRINQITKALNANHCKRKTIYKE